MSRGHSLSPAQRQRLDADRQGTLDRLHNRLAEQMERLHQGQRWRD